MIKTSSRRKKKKHMSFKIIFFGGLFFCLLGALAYFSIWSSFLKINKIEINFEKDLIYSTKGEIREIAEKELNKKIFNFIPQNSIVLAPLEKIKNNILEKFPGIKEINISRDFSDLSEFKVKIRVEERRSIGIWCKTETKEKEADSQENSTSTEKIMEKEEIVKECFQIDRQGVIYKESLLVRSSSILNIYSSRNDLAEIRDSVIPEEMVLFILNLKEKLEVIKTDKIQTIIVSDFNFISIEDLRVKTLWGWQIYFNPANGLDPQVKTLEVLLSEEIKDGYRELEYVDLRIPGRAYYK